MTFADPSSFHLPRYYLCLPPSSPAASIRSILLPVVTSHRPASRLKAIRDTNIYVSEAGKALRNTQLVNLRSEHLDTVRHCISLSCISLRPAICFVYELTRCLKRSWSRTPGLVMEILSFCTVTLLVVFIVSSVFIHHCRCTVKLKCRNKTLNQAPLLYL